MRRILLIGILPLLAAAHSSATGPMHEDTRRAPASQDSSGILAASIKFLRTGNRIDTTAPFMVDPRVLVRGPTSLPNAQDSVLHEPSALAGVNKAGVSQVVSRERADECEYAGPPVCGEGGLSVLLHFRRPVVHGDSATVEVIVLVARERISADSMAKLDVRGRFRERQKANSGSEIRIQLLRRNGEWTAYAMKILSQT